MFTTKNVAILSLFCLNIFLVVAEMKKSWMPVSNYPDITPYTKSNEEFTSIPMIQVPSSDSSSDNISGEEDDMMAVEEQAPEMNAPSPFAHFMSGFVQNYKSTYIGNITKPETISNDVEEVSPEMEQNRIMEPSDEELPRYSIGPGVKVSIDLPREIVNVNLEEDTLKDILTGRGKKYRLITKIMPLFILPFLIQSAIIPFMVSVVKLLLVKSILVGKIAVLLLILSAFKNFQKHPQPYEVPYYMDPPSRRSEASPGYKVDGQTSNWVN